MSRLYVILLTVLLSFAARGQTSHFVSTGGTHVSPFTNWVTSATNPIAVIAVLGNNASIILSNGTYVLTNEWLVSSKTNVIVRSVDTNPASVALRTDTNTFIWLNATNSTTVAGLTFEEWNNYGDLAMLRTVTVSRSTISNCVFRNNNTNTTDGAVASGVSFIVRTNGLVTDVDYINNKYCRMYGFQLYDNGAIHNTDFISNITYETMALISVSASDWRAGVSNILINHHLSRSTNNANQKFIDMPNNMRRIKVSNSTFSNSVTFTLLTLQYAAVVPVSTLVLDTFELSDSTVINRHAGNGNVMIQNISYQCVASNVVVSRNSFYQLPGNYAGIFSGNGDPYYSRWYNIRVTDNFFTNTTLGSFQFGHVLSMLVQSNYYTTSRADGYGFCEYAGASMVNAVFTHNTTPNIYASILASAAPVYNSLIMNNYRLDNTAYGFGFISRGGSLYSSIVKNNTNAAGTDYSIYNITGVSTNRFHNNILSATNGLANANWTNTPTFLMGTYRPANIYSFQVNQGSTNVSTNTVFDLLGNQRVVDDVVDIGPYEYFDSPLVVPYGGPDTLFTALAVKFATTTNAQVNAVRVRVIPQSPLGLRVGDVWRDGDQLKVVK
jgi:hypothetical protein